MKVRHALLASGAVVVVAALSVIAACSSDPASSPTHLGVSGDGGNNGSGDGGAPQGDAGGEGGSNFDTGGPIIVPNTKMVFVTADVFLGNAGADAGGLAAADQACMAAAAAAGISGTFMAWLSDGATNAADRLAHATEPYVMANGMQIAANWTDLVTNGPSMPITITEYGEGQPPQVQDDAGNFLDDAGDGGLGPCAAPVWTATDGTGQKVPTANCASWTDPTSASMGSGGGQTKAGWATGCTQTCDLGAALYCFQQ